MIVAPSGVFAYLNSARQCDPKLYTKARLNTSIMPNMEDYETVRSDFSWDDVYDSFDWDAPKELNMAHEICERWTGNDIEALVAERLDGTVECFTFEELDSIVNQFANALNDQKIERGDRVASLLPMIPEVYQTILGTLKAGAVYMPVFQKLGTDAISFRLQDSQVKALVTTYNEVSRINDLLDDSPVESVFLVDNGGADDVSVDSDLWMDFHDAIENHDDEYDTIRTGGDDIAFLQYTSGTTGQPKGCKAPHRMLAIHKVFGEYGLDFQQDDLFWCTADMGWATGPNLGMAAPWVHQVPVYQYEGQFDAEGVVDRWVEHDVTNFYSAPTAYRMMAQNSDIVESADLDHVRHLCSVGEPLNSEIIEWAREYIGTAIYDTYGQTECGLTISNYPDLEVRPGSMGKPTPGIDIVLLDENGDVVNKPNQTGEIAYPRGLPMFLDYWERPKKNEKVFEGGHYHSGDLAYYDEDGYYWYMGRADDVIITSGHRVSPFEIEECLIEHPRVTEVGVIGVPDEIRGKVIKAFVSTSHDYEPNDDLTAELQQFTKEQLAAHEYPRKVEYIENFPKTTSGKIQRHKLREREQE